MNLYNICQLFQFKKPLKPFLNTFHQQFFIKKFSCIIKLNAIHPILTTLDQIYINTSALLLSLAFQNIDKNMNIFSIIIITTNIQLSISIIYSSSGTQFLLQLLHKQPCIQKSNNPIHTNDIKRRPFVPPRYNQPHTKLTQQQERSTFHFHFSNVVSVAQIILKIHFCCTHYLIPRPLK